MRAVARARHASVGGECSGGAWQAVGGRLGRSPDLVELLLVAPFSTCEQREGSVGGGVLRVLTLSHPSRDQHTSAKHRRHPKRVDEATWRASEKAYRLHTQIVIIDLGCTLTKKGPISRHCRLSQRFLVSQNKKTRGVPLES
jgi:hypothetical protein